MLNTKKLLYILPDVAYIAELLPAKKDHSFTIQSFRQINGEFLNEDDLIADNVEKLFSKLEPEEYHVILPDFLFTNTIVEVQETNETKVKAYLKDELLPSLDLNKNSYQVETFILTQHQGKSKVQLAALEDESVAQLVQSAKQHNVRIAGITSISWTIKSVVSLEPSITVVQMGSHLYVSLHYIGIDQTSSSKVAELENIAETIKTLKGGEPSIQTVYLLTNELVADRLKENVSSTLPLQQLASFKEDETQMPSYVKEAIESAMKTLDIKEYLAPVFSLPQSGAVKTHVERDEEPTDDNEEASDLPRPSTVASISTVVDEVQAEEDKDDLDDLDVDDTLEEVSLPMPAPVVTPPVIEKVSFETTNAESFDEKVEDLDDSSLEGTADSELTLEVKEEIIDAAPTTIVKSEVVELKETSSEIMTTSTANANDTIAENTSSLAMSSTTFNDPNPTHFPTREISVSSEPPTLTQTKTVIKNKSGISGMLKMLFITLAVFFATVGIGVGIGFGILSWTNNSTEPGDDTVTPVATASPIPVAPTSPSPSPTASASPSAALDRSKLSILVVNATTISGHAGKTKRALDTAKYQRAVATNAKGEYDPGIYVLMAEKNQQLIDQLAADTDLELEYQATTNIEDPAGDYDAIIVLAE